MSSTSETGHSINAANFEKIISFCIGYGPAYNPSKASIQIPSLQSTHTSGLAVIAGVSTSASGFINATNFRYDDYAPIKAFCTRIMNALEATDATPALVRDAKTFNRRIQGSKAKKEINDTDPENPVILSSASISNSQQSYTKILDNFRQLVDLIAAEPSYAPNETELQITALNTVANNLSARNTGVIDSYTILSNARIQRNEALYNEQSGLVALAYEVKKYVKSVFGASSPQYKQISGIKFTRPKK